MEGQRTLLQHDNRGCLAAERHFASCICDAEVEGKEEERGGLRSRKPKVWVWVSRWMCRSWSTTYSWGRLFRRVGFVQGARKNVVTAFQQELASTKVLYQGCLPACQSNHRIM